MLIGLVVGSPSGAALAQAVDSAFIDYPGRIEINAEPDQVDLADTLARMARIASIYERHALGFTVDETTSVHTHDYRDGFKSTYNAPESVYCYYDAGHGRLDDRRIEKKRVKALHRKMARGEDIASALENQVDPLRYNSAVPSYVTRPYSWILLFSEKSQARYRYRLEGTHKRGLVIAFEPAEKRGQGSDWFGKVIVDPEIYQIVRAEGRQRRDLYELKLAGIMFHSEQQLPEDPDKRTFIETFVQAEFGTLQSGLRLPTKVETTVYHHVVAQPVSARIVRLRRAHEVEQNYRRYKFFGVDLEDEVFAVRHSED